jgi:ethanolamine kinase
LRGIEQLARFHATPVITKTERHHPRLFHTVRKWLSEISDEDVEAARIRSIEQVTSECGQPLYTQLSKQVLLDELQRLQTDIESLPPDVVFCHNDLLCGNIIYQCATETTDARVCFIDYEYGNYNYRCFDIGNHWAEWLGLTVDPKRQPSQDFQRNWLRAYAKTWLQVDADADSGTSIDEHVDRLHEHTNKFTLISHFHWGVWALVCSSQGAAGVAAISLSLSLALALSLSRSCSVCLLSVVCLSY